MQLIKTTLRHLNEACMTNQKDEIWKAEIKNILADIKPAFNCMHMKSLNHNENCTSYSIKGEHCFSLQHNLRVHIKQAYCLKYVLYQLLSRTYFTVNSLLTGSGSKQVASYQSKEFIPKNKLSIYHKYVPTFLCVAHSTA